MFVGGAAIVSEMRRDACACVPINVWSEGCLFFTLGAPTLALVDASLLALTVRSGRSAAHQHRQKRLPQQPAPPPIDASSSSAPDSPPLSHDKPSSSSSTARRPPQLKLIDPGRSVLHPPRPILPSTRTSRFCREEAERSDSPKAMRQSGRDTSGGERETGERQGMSRGWWWLSSLPRVHEWTWSRIEGYMVVRIGTYTWLGLPVVLLAQVYLLVVTCLYDYMSEGALGVDLSPARSTWLPARERTDVDAALVSGLLLSVIQLSVFHLYCRRTKRIFGYPSEYRVWRAAFRHVYGEPPRELLQALLESPPAAQQQQQQRQDQQQQPPTTTTTPEKPPTPAVPLKPSTKQPTSSAAMRRIDRALETYVDRGGRIDFGTEEIGPPATLAIPVAHDEITGEGEQEDGRGVGIAPKQLSPPAKDRKREKERTVVIKLAEHHETNDTGAATAAKAAPDGGDGGEVVRGSCVLDWREGEVVIESVVRHLTSEGWRRLVGAIAANSHIRHARFRPKPVGFVGPPSDEESWVGFQGVAMLAMLVTQSQSIATVNRLHVGPLVPSRWRMTTGPPRVYRLDHTLRGDLTAVALLAQLLIDHPTIEELYLRGNWLNDFAAGVLGRAIAAHRTLRVLNLSSNVIGDDGAVALGRALSRNKSLTHLSLRSNKIRKRGGRALADGLRHHPTLTYLNLGGNFIGPQGVIAVQESLRASPSMKERTIKVILEWGGTND
uniref:Uncharacterized protein n=1 Tax=Vitrella brassicaformis TaxID=1169539 RepID=A0A7S1NZB7_9ALVE